MKIVGVIDLLGGQAVRAVSGQRDRYRPVHSVAGWRLAPGDAVGLARQYVECLGVSDLYVADLDRILRRGRHDQLIAAIAALPIPLWVDAAVSDVPDAEHALDLGATFVIAGLETLQSFDALQNMCSALGGARIAFGLDLRDGLPVKKILGGRLTATASDGARHGAAAGVGAIVMIDVARVGVANGPDMNAIRATLDAAPHVPLLAGGGVRSARDLDDLAATGCDGVLVATALHDGALTRADVEQARCLHPRRPV